MPRSKSQLDRDIARAARAKSVSVSNLYAWQPKLEESIVDVAEGRISHSPGQALLVSQLDNPRRTWLILDGHHRAVEAILAGHPTIDIEIDEFVPRVERTGGAFQSYVDGKVNVRAFVRARDSSPSHVRKTPRSRRSAS